MYENIFSLLKKLSKTGNFRILLALLESPKRWSDLEKVVDKKTLSYGINELIELGLIKPILLEDSPKGSKAYVLTDFGKFVLHKLEEIEKAYKESVLAKELKQSEPEVETFESVDEEVSKSTESPMKRIGIEELYTQSSEEDIIVEAEMGLKELDIDSEEEIESKKSKRKKKKKWWGK